jgi:hypothetical protein
VTHLCYLGRMLVCISLCMCVRAYVYIFLYMCMYMCTCMFFLNLQFTLCRWGEGVPYIIVATTYNGSRQKNKKVAEKARGDDRIKGLCIPE